MDLHTAHPIHVDVTIERSKTKEVLRALLHAILFHRLFGTIKPTTIEISEVTFPAVSDSDIERLVVQKVDTFFRALEDQPSGENGIKGGQLLVTFSERRPKKHWFTMGEEEVPWEEWVINASVHAPKHEHERRAIQSTLPGSLTRILRTILVRASSESGRQCVPPIVTAGVVSPFPLRITVVVGGVSVGGVD
ncbi:hypothetical protein BOTBODRAFT_138259 [Botryobasidium botryosum FD-172 SS1]|uniref:Autophagy-related protein 101 n=1 Tax=Botryobasidium botryosum (strain FD-172 SS1) TaxID=930990 RepID=A0A067M2I8_BOTB1|nr:hypothetical protein BOTBODRAFT_138259 [Botryobasidium botryosum FD-172 SS1]